VTNPTESEDDPFRFGWRHIRHVHSDGTETWERVPLALEDVLHPQEEDFVAQSVSHQRRQEYLHTVISARLAHDPSAIVVADLLIAWDVSGLKGHAPDIAVILGVRERKEWSTFYVAEEGVRPILIIELTSHSTASLDRSNKLDEYDLAGVETYVIVDSVVRRDVTTLRLLGYILTPAGYQVFPPNEHGWLWLEVPRIWLGITDNEVVCYDVAGQPLGDYVAVSEALRAETGARTLAEQQARAEAETRRAEAEARWAAETLSRAEAETRLAAEMLARAETEARTLAEQRAEAEATARTLTEERLRQLEVELARLRGKE
jgi:Uma2 family endonuclease